MLARSKCVLPVQLVKIELYLVKNLPLPPKATFCVSSQAVGCGARTAVVSTQAYLTQD